MPNANGKHPGGRPTKYRPSYCQAIIAYFRKHAASSQKLVKLTDFAQSIKVCIGTIDHWQVVHPEFLHAVKTAMRFQEGQLCDMALTGQWNPAASIFLLKNNHGYRDHDRDVSPVAVNIHYGHLEQPPTVRVFEPIQQTNGDS